MSANNQIKIWKGKNSDMWHVHCQDVDTHSGFSIADAPTLEVAIERANNYMKDNEVEYGLDVMI